MTCVRKRNLNDLWEARPETAPGFLHVRWAQHKHSSLFSMPGFPVPPLLQFLFPPVIFPVILTAFADLMRFFRVFCIFVAPLYRNLQAHLQNELNPT